ncbi:MAG: SusC/RagA family TonB-linked outer membrane protein, partial [Bacteroidota bacterium]
MTKNSSHLFTLALVAVFLFAGDLLRGQSVSGTVTDTDGGQPLIGVTVLLAGSASGTVTDLDGKYTIEAKPGDVLTFSYTGMDSQSFTVGSATTINVQLGASNIALEQVIVTAYGTSKKGAFTGSAAQINAEDIANRPIANISDAINGAPGIQYSPSSGQPGASSPIRVRGFGSVNASATPLYVVDGIIFSGSLSSINPSDVESITVLKDAASTALYGSKAANGVVLVTTKSGRSGKPTFNVSLSQGFTGRAIPEYERVGPGEYYELQWEALRNGFVSGGTELATANQMATDEIVNELGTNPYNVPDNEVVGTDGRLNPNAQLLYPDDLDWQDPLVRQGSRTEANLSYQGGTDQTKYFTSIGYINEDGWIIGSDFQRFSGRVNVSTSPADWIRTGLNANIASSTANQAADGGSTSFVNPFFSTRNIAPIYPVFEHDPVTGEFLLDDAGQRMYNLGDNRVGNTNGRHVILETLLNRDEDNISTIGARAFVDLMFLKNFKFTVNAGYDNRVFNTETFGNTEVGDAFPLGRASRTNIRTSSLTLNQLLTYEKDFGVHNLKVLAGHESFEYERNFLFASREGQIAAGNTELINFATLDDANSNTRRYTTEGYLARAEYDYDNRYFLSASFRADGSSRFAEDVRWGEFFSVGAAWRLDQESFVQNLGLFDLLKLRASYGEVGNDSNLSFNTLSFFASQALLDLGNNNANEPG